eukprot:jgi/Botrbrau1/20542/Bobra.145_2s0091.1
MGSASESALSMGVDVQATRELLPCTEPCGSRDHEPDGPQGTQGLLELELADQEDEDGEEYEPLEVTDVGGTSHGPGPTALVPPEPPAYSWERLRERMLGLAGHISHTILESDAVWAGGHLMCHVAACLSLVRQHPHESELRPIMTALLTLAGTRIVACPRDLIHLAELWNALGVEQEAAGPAWKVGARGPGGAEGPLRTGQRGAIALASYVAGHVQGPAAATLWHTVDESLRPLVDRALGALAQQKALPDQESAAAKDLAIMACLVERYLAGIPGGADAHQILQRGGLWRSLVLLTIKSGLDPEEDLEPNPNVRPNPSGNPRFLELCEMKVVRRAAIIGAAAAPPLAAWAAAVPGFSPALRALSLQDCPTSKQHAALWELLLLPRGLHGLPQGTPQRLLDLLGFVDLQIEAGARETRDLLELLHTAQRAAGGRRLWGTDVDARLRNLQKDVTRLTAGSLRKSEKSSPSRVPQGPTSEGLTFGTLAVPHTTPAPGAASQGLRDSERSTEDERTVPLRAVPHSHGAPRSSTAKATSPHAENTEGFDGSPTDLPNQTGAAPSVPASADAPDSSPAWELEFSVGPPQETAPAVAPSREVDPSGIQQDNAVDKGDPQMVGAAQRTAWLHSASLLKAMLAGGDSKAS